MRCFAKPLFFVLIWTWLPLAAVMAQSETDRYTFEYLQDAYQPLSDPVILNPGIEYPGHDHYTVNLGFAFRFFDSTVYSLEVLRKGIVYFGNETEYLTPFRPEMVVTPRSQVGYQVSTEGGCDYRIFKLEWKHMGLICQDSLVGDVSVQLWLYESGSRIELRYGPQLQVSATEGCLANNISYLGPRLRGTPTAQYAIVIGSYEQPSLLQGAGQINISSNDFQKGIPPSGTVYRVVPVNANPDKQFTIGPNPTSGELRIQVSGIECEPYRIIVTDLWGRLYLQAETTDPDLRLNLGAYQPGWYLIRLFYPDSGVYETAKVLLTE